MAIDKETLVNHIVDETVERFAAKILRDVSIAAKRHLLENEETSNLHEFEQMIRASFSFRKRSLKYTDILVFDLVFKGSKEARILDDYEDNERPWLD